MVGWSQSEDAEREKGSGGRMNDKVSKVSHFPFIQYGDIIE